MKESPERLSSRAEFADGLNELKAETLSVARLADGWRAIEADMGGVTTAPTGSDLVATATEAGTLLKLSAVLLVAGSLLWVARHQETPDAAPAALVEPATKTSSGLVLEPDLSETPSRTRTIPTESNEIVREPRGLSEAHRAKPAVPRGVFKGPPPKKVSVESSSKPGAESSTEPVDASPRKLREAALGSDLAAYREAEALVHQGDYAEARILLEQLVASGSVVAPESQALRARVLSLEGNHTEAIEVLDSLLAVRPISRTRRASLLRMLGDALAKSGRCGRAILTYKKALELGVSPSAEEAIGRAIRGCGSTE